MQYGPAISDDEPVLQAIPNALLEYGREYTVRAFVIEGGAAYYSAATTASLTAAPDAITFNWTKLSRTSLPAEIELYETTDRLNGHSFHAWYAVADLRRALSSSACWFPTARQRSRSSRQPSAATAM